MNPTKVSEFKVCQHARALCLQIAEFYPKITNNIKHTLGDILITEADRLHKLCRRACAVYGELKLEYLHEAELALVDLVGTLEELYDANQMDVKHKADFDIKIVEIGSQVSSLAKSHEKRFRNDAPTGAAE